MKAKYTAILAVTALGAGQLAASTIGWWRMENGTSGETVTSLADSSGNGLTATAYNTSATEVLLGADTFTMPVVGVDSNTGAVRLNPNRGGNMSSTCFAVADSADTEVKLKPKNLTVEAFVRWDTECGLPSGATGGIFGKVRATPVSCTYGLGFSGDSLVARFHDGTGDKLITMTGITPRDGKWHHVAISFDDTTKKAVLWYDYTKSQSTTLSDSLSYAAGTSFRIGNVGERRMTGWIDEVRISDKALDVSEFLDARLSSKMLLNAAEPEGVLMRYRMGEEPPEKAQLLELVEMAACGWLGFPDDIDWTRLNLADWSILPLSYANAPLVTNDAVFATVRYQMTNTTIFADTKATTFRNRASSHYSVTLPTFDYLVKDDFTVECFMRMEKAMQNVGIIRQEANLGGSTVLWQIGLNASGTLTFGSDNGTDHWLKETSYTSSYANGLWHHVAFTYKKGETGGKPLVKLYFDHDPVATIEAPMNLHETSSTSRSLVFGQRRAGDVGWPGEIDEVRITRGVLTPDQFMAADDAFARNKFLVHYAFNGSDAPSPDSKAGFPTIERGAHSGGTVPVFTNNRWRSCVYRGPVFSDETLFGQNTGSLSMDNGYARIELDAGMTALLDRKKMTTECFVKFPKGVAMDQYSDVLKRSMTGKGGTVWTVRVDAGNRLYLLYNGTSLVYKNASGKALNDGQWHHLAVTLRESEDGTSSTITLYVDYEVYVSGTAAMAIPTAEGIQRLDIASANGSHRVAFSVDELCLTADVLPSEKFLRAGGDFRKGFSMILR